MASLRPHLKYFIDPGWRGFTVRLSWLGVLGLAAVTGVVVLLPHDDLIDVIDKEYQELVSVLLHVVIKFNFLLPEPGDEFLGSDCSDFPFLGHDAE